MPDNVTLFDRAVNLLKDHPVVAAVLLLSALIIGIGELIGAWSSIRGLFPKSSDAQPECRYLLMDNYGTFPGPVPEVAYLHITLGDHKFTYDGGDILTPKVLVFKGFAPGNYEFRARMQFVGNFERQWVAEVPLGTSRFYRLRWHPYAHTLPEDVHHLKLSEMPEDEFKRVLSNSGRVVIPSCTASPLGISHMI